VSSDIEAFLAPTVSNLNLSPHTVEYVAFASIDRGTALLGSLW